MHRFLFCALVAIALAACGQVGPSKRKTPNEPLTAPVPPESNSNAWAVASEMDLPTCDASRRGHIYFVESNETFHVCRSDGWATIELSGRDGEDGKDGKDGKAGVAGATG